VWILNRGQCFAETDNYTKILINNIEFIIDNFQMENIQPDTQLIRLLLSRLERISADSHLAHRASGVRGALHKALDQQEKGTSIQTIYLIQLIDLGFNILEKAGREMGK
jgi:hypothetical protein